MKNARGFTLIELIAYVGVLTIVLGAMTFYIFNIIYSEDEIGARVRIAGEADFAMRQIIDQIRGVKRIMSNAEGSAFYAGGNTSVLKLEKGDGSTVTFSVLGTSPNTSLVLESATTRTLTSPRVEVSQFSLVCIGKTSPCDSNPGAVVVTLRLKDKETTQEHILTTGVTPRGF